ncbi:MAG: LPXTG cell wall anchor domain-containing protein [Nitriliruptoraceae bacterium]
MRNRLTIATVALLLLVPANAFAQDAEVADDAEVDCYVNPDDPACSDIDSEIEEKPDDGGESGVEEESEIDEASVEILTTSTETDGAALAETGVSATLFSIIAALMLAAGALLLVVSRRRGSAV